ncbi:MAG TPA: arylesterase [Opitutaceae bacterium]|nr:arylesterase [Opitutaceae bacterium]
MQSRAITWANKPWARRAALALVLGSVPARPAPADAPDQRTIVFFGDSLTAGLGLADPDTQSYPAQVQRKIDAEHLPWHVVNAGLSGETSAGGLRRIDWVLRQRPDVFVLELGANDGLRGTATEVTRANLQAIIDRVRSKFPAARIVLAGMRMPQNMGSEYAEAFRAIYPALAQKNGIALIPFLLDGVAGRPDLNQYDGVHPTPSGAAIIAEGIWKSIAPMLRSYR